MSFRSEGPLLLLAVALESRPAMEKSAMQIKGLVRAANQVRSKLQSGISPEETSGFRTQVRGLVRQVEDLCREHGTIPDHLPGPSRQAYLFLKGLTNGPLPLPQDAAPAGPPGNASAFRVKGVVKLEDHLATRMWNELDLLAASPGHRQEMGREIQRQAAEIESICSRHQADPSDLEPPSRRVYCWLKFLSSGQNLSLHLEALARGEAALRQCQRDVRSQVQVHLVNLASLWRGRRYARQVLLKVNGGFLNADREVWRALVRRVVAPKGPEGPDLVREFEASEEFGEVVLELESFAAPTTGSAQGYVHNLEESFDRVNRRYFGGQLDRPGIAWTRNHTTRTFGHYQPGKDRVTLSAVSHQLFPEVYLDEEVSVVVAALSPPLPRPQPDPADQQPPTLPTGPGTGDYIRAGAVKPPVRGG